MSAQQDPGTPSPGGQAFPFLLKYLFPPPPPSSPDYYQRLLLCHYTFFCCRVFHLERAFPEPYIWVALLTHCVAPVFRWQYSHTFSTLSSIRTCCDTDITMPSAATTTTTEAAPAVSPESTSSPSTAKAEEVATTTTKTTTIKIEPIVPRITIPLTPATPISSARSPSSATLASFRLNVNSSLKSPALPSELPRSPMSATFSALPLTPSLEPGQKTPITPPAAYMEFLKNAIASPSDLKSPKFLPHHHPAGNASAGPSSPMHTPQYWQGKRYRSSLSGPSGGMPSPGLLSAGHSGSHTKKEGYTPTHSSGLSSASSSSSLSSAMDSLASTSRSSSGTSMEMEPSTADLAGPASVSSPKKVVRFVKSEGNSPNGKEPIDEQTIEGEDELDEDEVMEEVERTRRKSIGKDGVVTIKQVVTTTVTFKPRMSLMPAPKGKRRRIE
ncbi:hypothetical protein DFH27DRAFT_324706 [Peziza echinospora]|nr:hypothetical protein DFH27DRAFT_324706 [Peziza echinospora]